jgi:predicted kinase
MLMQAEPNVSRSPAPCLLLVGGAPASGKTHLAGLLATRYGAALCGKDALKEILFETLGIGARPREEALGDDRAGWSRRLSNASFALMFHFALLLLRSRRLLLLEGNFRPGEHEGPLAELLSAGGASLVQILCRAGAATRAARLAARASDPGRHPAHRDVDIDVTRPLPDFLQLPGMRLGFDSEAGAPALESLCRKLDALLPALHATAQAPAQTPTQTSGV